MGGKKKMSLDMWKPRYPREYIFPMFEPMLVSFHQEFSLSTIIGLVLFLIYLVLFFCCFVLTIFFGASSNCVWRWFLFSLTFLFQASSPAVWGGFLRFYAGEMQQNYEEKTKAEVKRKNGNTQTDNRRQFIFNLVFFVVVLNPNTQQRAFRTHDTILLFRLFILW